MMSVQSLEEEITKLQAKIGYYEEREKSSSPDEGAALLRLIITNTELLIEKQKHLNFIVQKEGIVNPMLYLTICIQIFINLSNDSRSINLPENVKLRWGFFTLFISIYLSVYPFIYLSVYLTNYLYIYLSCKKYLFLSFVPM